MKGHIPHSLEKIFPKCYEEQGIIFHYTCNSPDYKILKKHDILPIGEKFGCKDNREVLQIPLNLYLKKGFRGTNKENIIINCEALLKNL